MQGLSDFTSFILFCTHLICCQGQILDYKLGGGDAIKIIAPSGARSENVLGISCEKSRFYAKKSYFFPILGGCALPSWLLSIIFDSFKKYLSKYDQALQVCTILVYLKNLQ